MAFDSILSLVKSLAGGRLRYDDDWVDRLFHAWTVLFLVAFAILVGVGQFAASPITCITDGAGMNKRLMEGSQGYVDNYCWVSNSYFKSFDKDFHNDPVKRRERELAYYQWVPFVLLLQAALFFLPCFVWRTFNSRSGVSLRNIVQATADITLLSGADRHKKFEQISLNLERCFAFQRDHSVGFFARCRQKLGRNLIFCGNKYGNYLLLLYLLCKISYLAVACFQLWSLNRFLSEKHLFYPFEVFGRWVDGENVNRLWEKTGRFPRVTFCDVFLRSLGNENLYTFQCLLHLNMFNEVIYTVLMMWIALLVPATALNLLKWIWDMLVFSNRSKFVKKYLKALGSIDSTDRQDFTKFVSDTLKMDGVLILRMIAMNAGDVVAAEILEPLWLRKKSKRQNGPSELVTHVDQPNAKLLSTDFV